MSRHTQHDRCTTQRSTPRCITAAAHPTAYANNNRTTQPTQPHDITPITHALTHTTQQTLSNTTETTPHHTRHASADIHSSSDGSASSLGTTTSRSRRIPRHSLFEISRQWHLIGIHREPPAVHLCITCRTLLSALSAVPAGDYLAYLCSPTSDTRGSAVDILRVALRGCGHQEHR